jgi:hypothetical protein
VTRQIAGPYAQFARDENTQKMDCQIKSGNESKKARHAPGFPLDGLPDQVRQ